LSKFRMTNHSQWTALITVKLNLWFTTSSHHVTQPCIMFPKNKMSLNRFTITLRTPLLNLKFHSSLTYMENLLFTFAWPTKNLKQWTFISKSLEMLLLIIIAKPSSVRCPLQLTKVWSLWLSTLKRDSSQLNK